MPPKKRKLKCLAPVWCVHTARSLLPFSPCLAFWSLDHSALEGAHRRGLGGERARGPGWLDEVGLQTQEPASVCVETAGARRLAEPCPQDTVTGPLGGGDGSPVSLQWSLRPKS